MPRSCVADSLAVDKRGGLVSVAALPLRSAERRRRVLGLLLRGLAPDEAARQLRVPIDEVRRCLDRGLRELARRERVDVAEVRALEVARLDALQSALWPLACPTDEGEVPDLRAVDRILRIIKLRARLYRIGIGEHGAGLPPISVQVLNVLGMEAAAEVVQDAAAGGLVGPDDDDLDDEGDLDPEDLDA